MSGIEIGAPILIGGAAAVVVSLGVGVVLLKLHAANVVSAPKGHSGGDPETAMLPGGPMSPMSEQHLLMQSPEATLPLADSPSSGFTLMSPTDMLALSPPVSTPPVMPSARVHPLPST